MNMRIGTQWLPTNLAKRSAELSSMADSVTLAELELIVTENCLTRAEDTLSGVLSANPLAEWLVWNWWRLCYEPRGSGEQVPGWFESHRMTAAGGGWLWPNIEFVSDGVRMWINSKPTPAVAHQPLRYLSSSHTVIPLADFKHSIDDFIVQVCDRLSDQGVAEADLLSMWQELQAERADSEFSNYRRLEALLGFEPDEAPEKLMQALHCDAATLGYEAISELAAGAGNAVIKASQLQEWARTKGAASTKKNRLKWVGQEFQIDYQVAAWRNGVTAARTLRERERLDVAPIADHRLAEWFSVPKELLQDLNKGPDLAYEMDIEGAQNRVLLRSNWHAGRRFELARLLGDSLTLGTHEPLHLATSQNTYRQKLQRAFAAELLCPIEPLTELLKGDFSDDAVQEAANTFEVSPLMVTAQLVNNGVLQSGHFSGLNQELAVA